MVDTSGRYQITEGTDVYGSDGDKVGSVSAVRPNYVVVEKGFFFPTDYYIPVSAISAVEDGRVYLTMTKDAALNEGWDTMPADYESDTVVTTTDRGYAAGTGYATGRTVNTTTDTAYVADRDIAARDDYAARRTVDSTDAIGTTAGSATALAGAGTNDVAETKETKNVGKKNAKAGKDQPFEHASRTDHSAHVDRDERIAVPVHEEELSATKTARELGEVRVEKDVVAEERTLNVPVTEERVRVERRAVDRPVGADDAGFEDEVIEVPVYGEDVQLQKNVRVAEEVEIGKEAVQRQEQVRGTVRREEVDVVGDVVEGDADRRRDGGTSAI